MSEPRQPVFRERVRFAAPRRPQQDLLDPQVTTLDPPSEPDAAAPPDPGSAKSAGTPDTTPTEAAAGGGRVKSAAEEVRLAGRLAEALVGVLALAVPVARWVLRGRGISVRDMTETEQAHIADPLGRIAGRHLDLDLGPKIVDDLVDAAMAAGATTNYLSTAARRHVVGEGRPETAEDAA